jgi:uncharacterized protein (DUF1501 family)
MPSFLIENLVSPLTRRDWLRQSAVGAAGLAVSGWLGALAADAADHPQRKRSCILLWMGGGPSQIDTFDLKPGHANGGPFREIATATPGIRISEHLPRLARHTGKMALIRSMSTREGDHTRGTYLLRTGYRPEGSIRFPSLGALVAKEHGSEEADLPSFVSIGGSYGGLLGAGFLGPRYAPLVLGEGRQNQAGDADGYEAGLRVPNLRPAGDVTAGQTEARRALLATMAQEFNAAHTGAPARGRQAAYDRATRLMHSDAARAFNLDQEPPLLRDRYGRNLFGQGCLLARRLVERGVPFVEVVLAGGLGWDTHAQNFPAVRSLSGVLDPAWATLLDDLAARGLLDSTLVVWMGEFGRTPRINPSAGRDHFPNAWTAVLAGGGIRGGQVVGRTSPDGTTVEERPVDAGDLMATICTALGIDPRKQNPSNVGRPIRIADPDGNTIQQILA